MNLKDDEQQNIQLELDFSSVLTGEAREAGREGTESSGATSELESPASTNRLMEEVCERENLKTALRQVRANKGSPGVDGMTVVGLTDHLKQHWPAIREQLLNGTYEPQPVRRVEIPKPDGGGGCENSAFLVCWIDSSSRRCCRFCRGGGTGRFPITAMGSGRGGRLIKQWHRRSSISPQATAGALILIWRNFSIESITTN